MPLRIIVVDTEAKARHLSELLAGGADFAALAKQESQDPAAKNGGYLGAVRPASLRAELQEAIRGLRRGQRTGVIKVPTGYAVLQLVPESETVPENGAGLAGNIPLTPAAVVRQPPDTGGLLEVETLFQKIPRATGWNRDLGQICELHQTMVPKLKEQIRSRLASRDSDVTPGAEALLRYTDAVLEAYQGHMDQAIRIWEQLHRVAETSRAEAVPLMQEVLGTAYLHKAEMDNDIYTHPGERCLFPPRQDRPHPKLAKTDDLARAIQYFSKYLAGKPDDLEVKWLLNLAYWYLGQYPAGVPAAHLVPPALFECKDKDSPGRFEDVAHEAGVDAVQLSGGIIVDDFDGDGLLDIVTSGYDTCDHLLYFHNNGDGTFADRSVESGLAQIPAAANVTQADYDNDGCVDILVLRGGWQIPMPLGLLRGHCDGTFTDVTEKAGLRDVLLATQTAAWADIDNDGWLDLFVGNEQGPSRLFRNKRDGTFEDITNAAGIDGIAFTKTVAAADYDNDGYPDFFVSNILGKSNFLYHNNRDGTFREVAHAAGVAESWRSFGAWFFDYDNDGLPDLFVASDYASVEETMRTYLGRTRNAGPLKLYKNAGDGTFKDVTEAVGLDKVLMPMGANFGDLDSDGYLDIYLGTGSPDYGSLVPNVLLRNHDGRFFTDVSTCTATGEIHKTHGIAFADLENNGNEDIVVAMGGAVRGDVHALRLFRNPGGVNEWIGVKLVGVKTNRAGMGAVVKVTIETRAHERRTVYHTVNTGGSWGSSPLRRHIGLGRGARILELEVYWPGSRTRQVFTKVATRQYLEITELASSYRPMDLPSFRLGAKAPERAVAASVRRASHSVETPRN